MTLRRIKYNRMCLINVAAAKCFNNPSIDQLILCIITYHKVIILSRYKAQERLELRALKLFKTLNRSTSQILGVRTPARTMAPIITIALPCYLTPSTAAANTKRSISRVVTSAPPCRVQHNNRMRMASLCSHKEKNSSLQCLELAMAAKRRWWCKWMT